MFSPILLLALAHAEAGLLRDWWVPKDGHCLVNPDATEARKASADDLTTCRAEGALPSVDGEEVTDWAAVARCMDDRGWTKRSREKWDAWNAQCGEDVARQAQDFRVVTETLAAEEAPAAPAVPASTATDTSVPAGMLGRSDGGDE